MREAPLPIGRGRDAAGQQCHGFCLPVGACLGKNAFEMGSNCGKTGAHPRRNGLERSALPERCGDSAFRARQTEKLTQARRGNRRFGIANEDQRAGPLRAQTGR